MPFSFPFYSRYHHAPGFPDSQWQLIYQQIVFLKQDFTQMSYPGKP